MCLNLSHFTKELQSICFMFMCVCECASEYVCASNDPLIFDENLCLLTADDHVTLVLTRYRSISYCVFTFHWFFSLVFVLFSMLFMWLYLQIGATDRLSSNIACEIVWSPAFTRAGYQEPIVVEANFKATNLIVSITVYRFLIAIQLLWWIRRWSVRGWCCTGSLLQILLVVIEILDGRCWCAGCRRYTIIIWIKDFSNQHADPTRRRQTTTIQIMATWLQTPCHFNRLRKIAFVWNLNDIPPWSYNHINEHTKQTNK